MTISHDEADAPWNNLRDVLNAQAEGAFDCPGCGYLIDADSDCAECGFDPRCHDDECEIQVSSPDTRQCRQVRHPVRSGFALSCTEKGRACEGVALLLCPRSSTE